MDPSSKPESEDRSPVKFASSGITHHQQMAFKNDTPQQTVLKILRQDNVSSAHHFYNSELSIKNGIQKQVFVVVKNLTFPMDISSTIDLSKCNLEAKLFYDFDRDEDPKRLVSFVKSEPMDYKVNITDGGFRATVEVKIKVLTSQHEDMLFRIRFIAVDHTSGAEFQIWSQPIKVISKMTPTQTPKKGKAEPVSPSSPILTNSDNIINIPSNLSSSSGRKRTSNDLIVAALEKLERQQQEHSKILIDIKKKLYPEEAVLIVPHSSLTESAELETLQLLEEQRLKNHELAQSNNNSQSGFDLENSFKTFVSSLNTLDTIEKQEKVDSLVHSMSTQEAEKLFEFASLLDSSHVRKKKKSDE